MVWRKIGYTLEVVSAAVDAGWNIWWNVGIILWELIHSIHFLKVVYTEMGFNLMQFICILMLVLPFTENKKANRS